MAYRLFDAELAKSGYHPQFPARAKKLIGRWDEERRVWKFPARYRAEVLEILDSLYGYSESNTETVLVSLSVGEQPIVAKCTAVRAAGRVVARAKGRDTGAKLGDGVALLKGRVGSGGSAKNWETIVDPHTTLHIELPRSAAERLVSDRAPWDCVEIIDTLEPLPDPVKLRAQRAALEREIQEVDAMLARCDEPLPPRPAGAPSCPDG